MRLPFFLFLSIVFNSCATMSKTACESGRWRELGIKDAKDGLPREYFYQRELSCRDHNLQADRKEYIQGYAEGLRSYCTTSNGYHLGRQGSSYEDICPREFQRDFFEGYYRGKKEREAEEYYREHTRLKREEARRKASLMERFKANLERRECRWREDCVIQDRCRNRSCDKTGRACTFDSDCSIEGECHGQTCEF